MCRQIGILTTENADPRLVAEIIRAFQKLAIYGCVPPGKPAGHHDGWGIASFSHTAAYRYRSVQSAAHDQNYDAATALHIGRNPTSILIHLRKASVGNLALSNTHPFVTKEIAFAHNGTISEEQKIHLAAPFNILEGSTDSERFFGLIRQEMHAAGSSLAEAVRAAAHRILQRNIKFTALNTILITKDMMVASRIANTLENYYTLYHGQDSRGTINILCSEKIELTDLTWRPIENNSIIEINKEGVIKQHPGSP